MMPEKSPVRVEIERQILTALAESDRPMTLRELMPAVDAAEGPQQVARILGYMRNDGQVANGPDVQPGEPGGLSGKGARAVKAWCLPSEAGHQGKSADIVAVMRGQDVEARFDDELEWARGANSRRAAAYTETVEALDRLDDAADSHGGDEFDAPMLSGHGKMCADDQGEDPRRLADLRCSRCDPVLAEDRAALLLHGAEELLISIARERLRGDPVWDLANAHYQALMEVL